MSQSATLRIPEGLTFNVQTFGCQMNKHDSERIAGLLRSQGLTPVDDIEDSDVVLFMTCCVRESAESRLFGHVSSLKSLPLRPDSPLERRYIALGGCIGQRDGEGLPARIPHIDIVFGTQNIDAVPRLLETAIMRDSYAIETKEASEGFSTDLPQMRETPFSAWLPITVGCDNFCTYCIVPYVRGREKSRPMESIVEEARRYASEGVKEICLLGQNVNSYGRDIYGAPRFDEVLEAVAATGIDRVRFATSHPKDLTDEVIGKFGTLPNLMPALHLPVQSGSDRILKEMNRRYTREHYLELIAKLREACPDIALSTDVIIGFPGEAEQDFEDTFDLVSRVGYHQVFTFKYSPRSGTPAASMPARVSSAVVQERFDRLLRIVEDSAHEANAVELDRIVTVLVEGSSKKDGSLIAGKTPKNQTVHAPIPADGSLEGMVGRYVDIRITEPRTWYLFGDIVGAPHD